MTHHINNVNDIYKYSGVKLFSPKILNYNRAFIQF